MAKVIVSYEFNKTLYSLRGRLAPNARRARSGRYWEIGERECGLFLAEADRVFKERGESVGIRRHGCPMILGVQPEVVADPADALSVQPTI